MRYKTTTLAPQHPLAGDAGTVLVHRMNLYDKIGPGEHPCHWCGKLVHWTKGNTGADSLVVDHLDNDRKNAEIANLVPSCTRCNVHRARKNAIREGEVTIEVAPGVRARAVALACPECGTKFLLRVALLGRSDGHCCSRHCSIKRQWRVHRHRPSPSTKARFSADTGPMRS